ncbi:MAG: AMP-binding protein [Proteobacteria bacterium]|nr:AMP-binding protein [Pseudomonadota bacterium]
MISFCNIASTMEAQAHLRPFQRAVVFPHGRDSLGRIAWTHLTCSDLNRLTDEFARGFDDLDMRDERVFLLLGPSLEWLPVVFALFKVGAVPILTDTNLSRSATLSCLERTTPRVLIAPPLVHAWRRLYSRSFKSVEIPVTIGDNTWFWGGSTLQQCRVVGDEPFPTMVTTPEDEAAIVFTSGTTGPPKAVSCTHGFFDQSMRQLQQMYGIQPGEIELASMPLFALLAIAMGMTVVLPGSDLSQPNQTEVGKIVEVIQTQGCSSSFGGPTLWSRIGRWCHEREVHLNSLRRIVITGARVPIAMHKVFRGVLGPGRQIHTLYGNTECLAISSIGSEEALGETALVTNRSVETCLGHPLPLIKVGVIKIVEGEIECWSDELLLSTGEIGEIVLEDSPMIAPYLGETRSTSIPDGESAFHRTGDLGYLDGEHRLWFCGRKSNLVVTKNGERLFPVPCEAIFDAHPDVRRTALVGVDGEPRLVVELQPPIRRDRDDIAAELLALGQANPLTIEVKQIHFHPKLPLDVHHRAKIHRLELAAWAKKQSRS